MPICSNVVTTETFIAYYRAKRKPKTEENLSFNVCPNRQYYLCISSYSLGQKFTLLTILDDEDLNQDSLTSTFNAAVSDIASEILWKYRWTKSS